MGPAALAQVLRPLSADLHVAPPELLVGLSTADDAAVYRVSDDRAVVLTLDFFPPVVDDAYTFGAIAAANAMSDIYAMGGEVAFGLNIAAFPEDLPLEIISEILRGSAETMGSVGAVIAGGHTIIDREPKYGLCVVGFVHPQRILTKGGARAGDILYLTKPLGTGIVLTKAKQGGVDPAHLDAVIASMRALNREPARIAVESRVHALTDITGFGLLGHALEVARASGAGIDIDAKAVPLLPGALEYARAGITTGGAGRNRVYLEPDVTVDGADAALLDVLYDPQTSGGLLLAVASAEEGAIEEQFRRAGLPLYRIGRVRSGSGIRLT